MRVVGRLLWASSRLARGARAPERGRDGEEVRGKKWKEGEGHVGGWNKARA